MTLKRRQMDRTKKQIIYQQKFRQEWKRNPKLKDWLREDEMQPNRAYCIYCGCNLLSKFSDLITHAGTKKHLKAVVMSQQRELSDSLPLIKDVTTLYTNNVLNVSKTVSSPRTEHSMDEIEMIPIKPEKRKRLQKPQKSEIKYIEEPTYIETDPIENEEDEEEITRILSQTNNEFDAVSSIPKKLREAKIKAEIEYYQQKTQYFAKLTENTRVQKTLMILQARKLNLEIKKMQEDDY